MKKLVIEKKEYILNDEEFPKLYIEKYCNLDMYQDIELLERLYGLIGDVCTDLKIESLLCFDCKHGGFIPLNLVEKIEKINVFYNDLTSSHKFNLSKNIENLDVKNISINDPTMNFNNILFIYSEKVNSFMNLIEINDKLIILTYQNGYLDNKYKYSYLLSSTNYKLYVPEIIHDEFLQYFKYYIHDNILNYDNLINLCIMVKNGGDQFEYMLKDNLHLIDRWTILDTGSTDNTISIIKNVLKDKKGDLYEEPFVNFKHSRNRLLDLAGEKCKYTLMLDDTYVIKSDLKKFLKTVRSDQFADSFSLFIKSDDTEYGSNRILKAYRKLRYLYRIHEVIDPKNNNNVIIPIDDAYIIDNRFEYMEKRTMDRKSLDLKFLYEEIEEDPNDPRAYYYLAQTYNLLSDNEKAFEWFDKRVKHENEGFIQEKVDAAFERARIANFKLNLDWDTCEKLYLEAYELDKSRPESLYFIGIHYFLENRYDIAYVYFKEAFEVGYPSHCQYSLKPTLSFHFLPKFLTKICYAIGDNELGLKSSDFYLKYNNNTADEYKVIVQWYLIYKKLMAYTGPKIAKYSIKPILCFVADGGFNKWSGSSINKIGVGGSETYIIQMARYIQKHGHFQVYVFCNCETPEEFEGVRYMHLDSYYEFINTNYVHSVIISRYTEYLPVTYNGFCDNVYLVLHDLLPSGSFIIYTEDGKLKNIFCLTEWHVNYFNSNYNMFNNITVPHYYGIDVDKFDKNIEKIPYKFIYSSFPNRGLYQLLQMWPRIHEKENRASLHIYADLENEWVNNVAPELMKNVKELMEKYKDMNLNIHYHGWVNKSTLYESWLSSDVWFYPCTFAETFCLTATEAAISKTLVITNDLAALQNTVGDRGIIIPGDPNTDEWKEKALQEVFKFLENREHPKYKYYTSINYDWAKNLTWENQANKLLNNYILKN